MISTAYKVGYSLMYSIDNITDSNLTGAVDYKIVSGITTTKFR